MTPEGRVKSRINRILKKFGDDVWKVMPRGGPFGKAGTPDYLVCVGGKFLAIEAKAGDNKPTDIQKEQMAAIRRAGGTTLVINEGNLDEVETAISRLLNVTTAWF